MLFSEHTEDSSGPDFDQKKIDMELMAAVSLMRVLLIGVEASTEAEKLAEVEKGVAGIEKAIGRPLTSQEKLNLYQGALQFNRTEEATNERLAAVNYLMKLKFLEQEPETTKKHRPNTKPR